MPINEAAGWRRSNLTKQQRLEQEAAIRGIRLDTMSILDGFTPEQIAQLQAELAARGGQRQGMREFDINNPPKEPYQHQEYPRMMYHHGKRDARLAHNEEDVKAALEAGWSKEPFPAEEPVEEAQQPEAPPAPVRRGRRAPEPPAAE